MEMASSAISDLRPFVRRRDFLPGVNGGVEQSQFSRGGASEVAMPGRGYGVEEAVRIRKRCALSSSGASNPARSGRPAVLLRRRRRREGAGAEKAPMSESSSRSRHSRRLGAEGVPRSSASARKLVAAFWQTDKDRLFGEEEVAEKHAAASRSLVPRSHASTEVSRSSRSRCRAFDEAGGRKGSYRNGHGLSADVTSNCSAMEIGTRSQDDASKCPEEKAIHLKDLYNSLIASKELAKVLAHIWGELNPSTVSLISALRSELDLARAHVRRLIKEQKSESSEVDYLKKELMEEMESWKAKQKEKAATALQYIVTELDHEKKSRKRAEKTNKKLGAALADTESSLRAAMKELERERKSKGRVEKICSELVRGIGEVEALKRETEIAQEDLQKEREMLQLADEWREQRVQMKLLEARLQFEEKNAAVNQLHEELQAYLDTKKDQEPAKFDLIQSSHATGAIADNASGGGCSDDSEECDSEGGDMHSIELNVDDNKFYTWSYTPSSRDNQRGASMNGSFSDRGIDGSVGRKTFEEMDDALEGDWAEGCSNVMLSFDHDEERYLAIKNLREQMIAGSGLIKSQGSENAEREFCNF